MMKKLILASAVLALAACGETTSDEVTTPEADVGVGDTVTEAGPDAGFEAVAPGSYTVAHEDGTSDELSISPGMTWSMVFADGTAAGGTIFAQDGKNCFVTEGVEGHQCFAAGDLADDGSMEVTADDGEVMTVTPVAMAAE